MRRQAMVQLFAATLALGILGGALAQPPRAQARATFVIPARAAHDAPHDVADDHCPDQERWWGAVSPDAG